MNTMPVALIPMLGLFLQNDILLPSAQPKK